MDQISFTERKNIQNAKAGEMKAKLTVNQAKRYEIIPSRYQYSWLKCVTGNHSARKCIKAKCEECVGYEQVIERVANCSAESCPLFIHRPYQ